MGALLGADCRMDPSVFCWIASAPPPHPRGGAPGSYTGGARRGAAGANFGMPHRDFTCLQSLRKADGGPAVLSVWLPLGEVTSENGCMMVLPRAARGAPPTPCTFHEVHC